MSPKVQLDDALPLFAESVATVFEHEYWYCRPGMSAAASLWFEKLTVTAPASLTGPLFPSVAVGATLLTVTVVEYSVTPPSLSEIRPLTTYEPLSPNEHWLVAIEEAAEKSVAPGHLNW